MQHARHTGLVVVSVSVAIVALLAAIAVAAGGYVLVHRDHTRIHELERQVNTLCNRRVVTGVNPSITSFSIHTAKGC
ncbi:MAG TPA: hypothetical protein VMH47_03915 [Gaiellaceae bacterium]|nr:hypothetical protein [Gaiellaceae bacterium]